MSKPKALVLYHAGCLDGFAAAFAAYLALGESADYRALKYGEPLHPGDLADLVDERDVYILDYSFTEQTVPALKTILSRAAHVVWLDHHGSSFKAWCGADYLEETGELFVQTEHVYNEASNPVACHLVLDNTKSGALLAWEYFHPDKPVPHGYLLIDDGDRWKHQYGDTRPFQKALWARAPWTFHDWDSMYGSCAFDWNTAAHNALLMEGLALQRAHGQRVGAAVNGGGMGCILPVPDGIGQGYIPLHGKAANCPPDLTSDVGHELALMSGTFGLCWYLGYDGKVNCSLRSNGDYDVSAIAEAFGGGGHKNAAGFTARLEELGFWLSPDMPVANKVQA